MVRRWGDAARELGVLVRRSAAAGMTAQGGLAGVCACSVGDNYALRDHRDVDRQWEGLAFC
jgi:hypothetical protein